MKTQLIILSDLHIKASNSDHIFEKIIALKEICGSENSKVDKIIFLIAGDISFSGESEQFETFQTSFELLKEEIHKIKKGIEVELITAPGNHDVEFTPEKRTCTMLVDHPDRASAMQDILSRQDNYFSLFYGKNLDVSQRIHWDRSFPLSERYSLDICVLNSSVFIKKDIIKGTIDFPSNNLFHNQEESNSSINITMLHHPLSWFTETSRAFLKEFIGEKCDILITGHEHQRDVYTVNRNLSVYAHYEAPAFNDDNTSDKNGVTSLYLKINEEDSSCAIKEFFYIWDGKKFTKEGEGKDSSILLNKIRRGSQLSHTFENWLNELPEKIIHPNKEGICLDEIFVYPSLQKLEYEKKRFKAIHSYSFLKDNLSGLYCHITGESKSGKTCLAKEYFKVLFNAGKKPIYINFEDEALYKGDKLIKTAFQNQYCKSAHDEYLSHEYNEKVLIIDNFDISINTPKKIEYLIDLKSNFSSIIVFGENLLTIDTFTNPELFYKFKEEFKAYKITEFGKKQRAELINKWELLNPESKLDEERREYKLLEHELEIDRLFCSSLIQKYPLFICMFLQARSYASTNKEAKQIETCGGLYEIVIRKQIASTKFKSTDYTTATNYLQELSYWLYSNQIKSINITTYDKFSKYFNDKYATTLNSAKMLSDLELTGILTKVRVSSEETNIAFTQKYYYYYFIAKHLSDNISKETAKKEIIKISKNIHQISEASIWLFITHISSDPFIIETISEYASSLFSDIKEIQLDDDITFVENLKRTKISSKMSNEIYAKRKENRITLENKLEEEAAETNISSEAEESLDNINSPVIKMITAFRTIDILGQLLRNFTGKLIGEYKIRLLRETYSLALRSLEFTLGGIRDSADAFVAYLVDLEQKKGNNTTEKVLLERYSTMAYRFLQHLTFAILHKVAISVSHPQLKIPYSQIESESEKTNARILLHRLIELNTTKSVTDFVEKLCKSNIRKKPFCYGIINDAAVWHCYFYPISESVKQAVCEKLGIEYNSLLLLENKKK